MRLDEEMTLHDADMTRFGQWWQRMVRAGHAYAEGAWMHGGPPERHWVRESLSIWFWGFGVPGLALAAAWPTGGLSLILLLGYPVLWLRVYLNALTARGSRNIAALYSTSCVLGKLPQFVGQLKFLARKLLRREARIIEYK